MILFLLVIFCVGLTAKLIKSETGEKKQISFDYSEQDSLFNKAKNLNLKEEQNIEQSKKNVDSEQELLDLSKDKILVRGEKSTALTPHSININTANLQSLTQLPGVGTKTAKKIIEFREKNGSFVSIKQIMQIKGIGEKKYLKIKEYIVTEN